MRTIVLMLSVICAFSFQAGSDIRAEDAKKTKILYVSQSAGFVHGSVRRPKDEPKKLAPSEIAMMQLASDTGKFTVDCTQDCAADFTVDNLKHYDIVMFYTTGKLPISDEARDFFIKDWLKQKGHGFMGIHSATDTFYDKGNKEKNEELRWYWEMIGGSFNGHPWGAGSTNTFTIHDTKHPAMKPFGREYVLKDEIYQYMNWQPEKVHVLMSLNMEKSKPQMPYHVPVSWCKNWGEGKVFVNNMGHNESTWQNKDFLQSLTNAIAWIRGEAEGDATPNPDVSAAEEAKAKAVVESIKK